MQGKPPQQRGQKKLLGCLRDPSVGLPWTQAHLFTVVKEHIPPGVVPVMMAKAPAILAVCLCQSSGSLIRRLTVAEDVDETW